MWRIHRDESSFSDARKLTWEYVLPYKHVPIIENDEHSAKRIEKFLNNAFTEKQLKSAVKRLNIK